MRQSPLFVLLLAASSVAAAQEPPARAFESATVRPRTGTSGEEVISGLTPERSNASNVALRSLVAYA